MPNPSNPTLIIIAAAGLIVLLSISVIWSILKQKKDGDYQGSRRNTSSLKHNKLNTKQLDDETMREIYKSLATMTATLNYQRVLDATLDISMQALAESGSDTGTACRSPC